MGPVTIIGAGPAGSTAAILLARRGCEVTLLEQHRFPRDKVCGECLSALGMDVLKRLGLASRFRSLGARQLTGAAVHLLTGKSSQVRLPRAMWGLTRSAFDQMLLEVARESGARVLQPARCESIEPGDRPVLRVRDLVSNSVQRHVTGCVLLADGKSALLGTPPSTGDLGVKAHFTNVNGPREVIELFGCRGFYGGLAAVEGARWNAAFSIPTRLVRQARGNLDGLLQSIIEQHPMLRQRLGQATRMTRWLASPLPRFPVRHGWPPGVTPIGNAAAALEPIGGEGMGLAMRSAELAVDAIRGQARPMTASSVAQGEAVGGCYDHALYSEYTRIWSSRRAACRGSALVVSNSMLAAAAVPLLGVTPLRTLAIAFMGK